MPKSKIAFNLASAMASISVLGGCSLGVTADAERMIQSNRNDANDLVRTSSSPLPKKEVGPVVISNDVWLGDSAKALANGDPLPRSVEREGVTLISSYPMGIVDIAQLISRTTGIAVELDRDIFEELSASGDSGGQQASIASSADSTNGVLGSASAEGGESSANAFNHTDVSDTISNANNGYNPNSGMSDQEFIDFISGAGNVSTATRASNREPSTFETSQVVMEVSHIGKLSDFLDNVSLRFRIGWKYEDRKITFYKNLTNTYLVKVLPSTNSASIQIGGESDSGVGASSQASSSEYEIDLWSEISEALSTIVGDAGTFTASRSTGTVSVTAPPSVMKRVESYIQEQNQRFSQQVALNVQVFNVGLNDSDDISSNVSLDWVGGSLVDAGFDAVSSGGAGGAGLAWSILRPVKGFDNITGIVQALSTKGDVSVVTTANATTLNNVPTPIQVGNTRGYVASVESTTDADGNVSTSMETASITTGFNMQLIPRVMGNGIVALQYNISTSELIGPEDGFEVFSNGDSTVQLPNMNNRAFTQQVMIPNGNTLVLAGFEQTKSSVNSSGTGFADNWLMGGSKSGSMRREVMVIMITPVLMDTSALIEKM